ncbi:8639_t:CDS:2, partial [Gigaspora rosea]
DGQSKPVVLMLSDGGPNENLHYKKTILMNGPLSHDLARIILPHDTFGSHLDEQLKTADDKLEKLLVEYIDSEEHDQSKLDEKSAA